MFTVTLAIEIEAETPKQAAEQYRNALAEYMHLDLIFDVRNEKTSETFEVQLAALPYPNAAPRARRFAKPSGFNVDT